MKPDIQYFAESGAAADVQRDIRRTRALRAVAAFAAALNAVMLAVNTPHGGLVALILAPFSAAAVIGCVVMIVRQTRLIGRQRRTLGTLALTGSLRSGLAGPPANARAMSVRENVLRRIARRPYHPPMTTDDYRRLTELEAELGWAPGGPAAAAGAPMTGPGGRWRPVSELFEHDARAAKAAEHFAALGRVGRESCADPCPMCEERPAGSETMETMRRWLETERWEQP